MYKIVKEFPRVLVITTIIFLILVVLPVINGKEITFDQQLQRKFSYTFWYTVILYYANMFLFLKLRSYYKGKGYTIGRLIVSLFSSLLVSVIVIFLIRLFTAVFLNSSTAYQFLVTESLSNYIVTSVISFVVFCMIYALYYYRAYNEGRIKEQKVIAGAASAQFESLKNQIDPHFLFNSLNVLSSLIEENPENAQRFTTALSKVYRYVLEQKDKQLVPVLEELAFAKTYMNLLKMRFEESLDYDIQVNNLSPDAQVVPLSLQLLLENAVKHNTISATKPLQIRIYEAEGCLVVQNNYQKKSILQSGQGVGLQNIISRYAMISEAKVVVAQDEQNFTVYLPILTNKTKSMETTKRDNSDNAYYQAKMRVEELKGFYGNLISYCIIIPFLIFINLKFSPQFQWFWFSAAGWGFGLLMHAVKVFGYSSNWEKKKIETILQKQQAERETWK